MKSSTCGLFLVFILIQTGDLVRAVDSPIQITIGKPLHLTCNDSKIQSSDTIEWIKDGEEDNPLYKDPHYQVSNHTLLIPQADTTDAGTYECRTTSPSPITKLFSVVYFDLKNLTATQEFTEGATVNLKCQASGKPIPTVQWLKDGQKLNDSKYDYASNEDHIANAELSFLNAQQNDSGEYTCQVFSEIGVTNTTAIVTISEPMGAGTIAGYVILALALFLALVAAIVGLVYLKKK